MKRLGVLTICCLTLFGCGRKPEPPPSPAAPATVNPLDLFPKPTEFQSNRLAEAAAELRGSVTNLDLSWIVDIGAAGVPALVEWAGNTNLTVEARDGVLILLGNSLKKLAFYETPDARNDLIAPVIIRSLGDADPRVRRSAAYAARWMCDGRLVAPLRVLFADKDFVQEQAVLATGSNGGEMEVLPVLKLFFETNDGKFRYSCLYALSTLCLRTDVDVAGILRQNATGFGEKNAANAETLAGRFAEWRAYRNLVMKLDSPDKQQAEETLAKMAPDKNLTGSEAWRKYLVSDFWLQPPPPKPPAS